LWWWREVIDERWKKSSEQLTTDKPIVLVGLDVVPKPI
jgi:hypothetical protein